MTSSRRMIPITSLPLTPAPPRTAAAHPATHLVPSDDEHEQAPDPEYVQIDRDVGAFHRRRPKLSWASTDDQDQTSRHHHKVSRQYKVNPHLLCEINGHVADGRQMPDGSTRLQPGDHLRFKTELFLPTPSDEERFEASTTASSASDNDEGSHGSTEDSPDEPVESKAPADDISSVNAVCAPYPLPRDEQLVPTEYACLAYELDTRKDNYHHDMAAAFATTPVAFAASTATEELLTQCHHLIQDGFIRTHRMHQNKNANRIIHDIQTAITNAAHCSCFDWRCTSRRSLPYT